MENWQNTIYKDYIAGKLSEQGRSNYEVDVLSGVMETPEGADLPFMQEAQRVISRQHPPIEKPIQAAHLKEAMVYLVPDDVWKSFTDGSMSIEGMTNLMGDLKAGRVVAPESEDVPVSGLRAMITGEGRRVPETESLPSWTRMPEMNNLSLKGLKSLTGTMAAGPKEISQVIKEQNPDVEVTQDSKGNYVFTSAMDGKQYAVKPGFRSEEDILRGASTAILMAMGSRGGAGKRMTGAAGTQFAIEATQEATGAEFDAWEIPLAALFEGGGILAGKGAAALKGFFSGKTAPAPIRKAMKKLGFELPEKEVAKTIEETTVEAAERVGVTPMTSDIYPPKTFAGKVGQATTERIPLAGTGGPRAKQQASRVGAIRQVLTDYGADESARASDDVMRDLLKKRGADINKYTTMKGEVIERLSGETTVPLTKTTSAVDTEIAQLRKFENPDTQNLADVLEQYSGDLQNRNLVDIETLRKQLGEKLKSADLATVKDQAQKSYRKIYSALRDDMGNFIKETGEPRDFNKWQLANKRLSGMMDNLNITTFKSAIKKGDAEPEQIRRLLFSQKPSHIKQLYRSLTPEGKSRAKVAIWQEAVEKAGGLEKLSTARFETALKKLEKSTGVFFKGEDKQVLNGLVKTLEITKRAETAAVTPPTGVQLAVWSAPTAASWFLGGNPVAGLAATGGIGLTARAYESKPVRNLLIKISKGKGKEQQYIKALVNILRTSRQYNKPQPARQQPGDF